MAYTCQTCKYGLDRSPDGKIPRPGTVWCSKRKIGMGKNRGMSCFVPIIAGKSKKCLDCKWARKVMPTGGAPTIGKVWCERRHFEINKMRIMECYEL